VPDVTDTLLRLLEALAILVPLTGIFVHQGFRMTRKYERPASRAEVVAARLALVGAGAALAAAGMVVAGALVATPSLVVVRVAGAMVYTGFLGFLAVLLVGWVMIHAGERADNDQATLAEVRDRPDAESVTASDAATGAPGRADPGTLIELLGFVLAESALAFVLVVVYVQTDAGLAGTAAAGVFGIAAAFVGYGFFIATRPELKTVFEAS
jgi:hypothetical protein